MGKGPPNRRTPPYRESTDGSTPPCPQPKTPRPRYGPSVRRSWPPTWTPTQNEPAPTWGAADCKWCCGCSRSTPKHGWPNTSTPTSPTPTSTGRSYVTCSTSAATSTTRPTRSPSPSTDQSAPESPAPSNSSPKNSTPHQQPCPATTDR